MAATCNILMGIFLVIGLFFNTLGVVGILRFPDVYTRLHADTKATTFGSIFIGLATIVWAIQKAVEDVAAGAWVNLALHVVVAVVVLCVTNATGGHAIARAAWRAGYRPARAVVDVLAEDAAAGTLDAPPEPEKPAQIDEIAPETPKIDEKSAETPPEASISPEKPSPAPENAPEAAPSAPEAAEQPAEAPIPAETTEKIVPQPEISEKPAAETPEKGGEQP